MADCSQDRGFPSGYAGDLGDTSLIPGSGRSHGGGQGTLVQCSCLGNPIDRGAWRGPWGHKESDITE